MANYYPATRSYSVSVHLEPAFPFPSSSSSEATFPTLSRRVPLRITHRSTGPAVLGECLGQQQRNIHLCTVCKWNQQVPAALGTLSSPVKEASCWGRYFLSRSTISVLSSSITRAMEDNLLGHCCLQRLYPYDGEQT